MSGLSLVAASGASLLCSALAFHCGGFSCCGAWALGARAHSCGLQALGVQALERSLSSCGAWA